MAAYRPSGEGRYTYDISISGQVPGHPAGSDHSCRPAFGRPGVAVADNSQVELRIGEVDDPERGLPEPCLPIPPSAAVPPARTAHFPPAANSLSPTGRRRRVTINARTDALEQEYAYGRLSEAAYRAGRVYQRVLERSGFAPSLSLGWPGQEKVDTSRCADAGVVRALDGAREADAMMCETRPVVGLPGERILLLVLGRGLSLTEAAAQLMTGGGNISRHAASFYAWLFRQSLEELAGFWSHGGQPARWRHIAGAE